MEKDAIAAGLKENGQEDADKVIRSVLSKRHAQETNNLERQFAAERKVVADDAAHDVTKKYEKMLGEARQKHDLQLADLQRQNLTPDEMESARASLLNDQQLEMSDIERRQQRETNEAQQAALSDREVRCDVILNLAL